MSEYLDRKQVIDLYEKHHSHLATYVWEFGQELKALPTVEPKQGEWIEVNSDCLYWNGSLLKCSNCGKTFCCSGNFCPNCGASMRVKDELNRVSKELNSEIEKSKSEIEAKVKELENAIAKCEKAEEDFKKRTCKFRSPTNCDFCSFHSECDEHWKGGDEK